MAAKTTGDGSGRGAHGDGTWTGSAADAFRTQLGKLPGDLDKVHESYSEVAHALDVYEAQLGPLQSQFRTLSSQLTTARGNLTTAQGNLATAKSNLTPASSAPHAISSSKAVVDAQRTPTPIKGQVMANAAPPKRKGPMMSFGKPRPATMKPRRG